MICLKNHNAITEEVKEIALSANDNKRIQSIVLIETYAFWTNEEIKCKK